MPALRRLAALTAACLALSPAAALAQGSGAGDEQYSDPFSETNAQTTKPKQQVQSSPSTTTQQQAAPSASTSTAPQSTAPAPAQQSSGQLPRTGFDVAPLALLGVALIGAGVLLLRRRRV